MSTQQQARGVLMGLLDTPHHFDKRHRSDVNAVKGVTSEVGVFPAAADCPFQGPVRTEGRNIVVNRRLGWQPTAGYGIQIANLLYCH